MTEISNPRRILAVSLADSAEHLSQVIKDLTGSFPEPVVISSPPPQSTSTSSAIISASPAGPLPLPAATTTTTLAGTTHPLPLKTAYYSASVPIWLDLISSPEEWSASFLSDEAKEVLEVLGGVLVIFPLDSSSSAPSSTAAEAKELVAHVGRVVREGLGGTDWEGVGLAVGVSSSGPAPVTITQPLSSSYSGGELGEDLDAILDEWEDYCWDSGLEFVHHRAVPSSGAGKPVDKGDKRNEFGEKMGLARVLEALQANEWSFAGGDDDSDEGEEAEDEDFGSFQKSKKAQNKGGEGEEDDGDAELNPENLDFGFDRADFVGLRNAIWKGGGDGRDEGEEEDEGGDEDEVKKLERMMHKLQAVRDMTAGMPEEQRKRMAKRAVDEVMKEL